MSRAWRCWNEQHSRLVRQRQITQRIVYHWRSCHVAVAFRNWADRTEDMKWHRHLEKMAQRMRQAGGKMKAFIFVHEMELGQVLMTDPASSGMSIIIDMAIVPWEVFKTLGQLRFRLESCATPGASPCATPPNRVSDQESHCKLTASSPSPLYMSSQSPAVLFPAPKPAFPLASAGCVSTKPVTAAEAPIADSGETIYGAAFYMNTPTNRLAVPVSGEATAARWGLTIDMEGAKAVSRNSPEREELLQYVAALNTRAKGNHCSHVVDECMHRALSRYFVRFGLSLAMFLRPRSLATDTLYQERVRDQEREEKDRERKKIVAECEQQPASLFAVKRSPKAVAPPLQTEEPTASDATQRDREIGKVRDRELARARERDRERERERQRKEEEELEQQRVEERMRIEEAVKAADAAKKAAMNARGLQQKPKRGSTEAKCERVAAEAEERKKADEERKRKAEEEEAARRKKVLEEEAAQEKAEEAVAARKKAVEEEAARKKAEEAAAAAAKKAAEEEEARKKAEVTAATALAEKAVAEKRAKEMEEELASVKKAVEEESRLRRAREEENARLEAEARLAAEEEKARMKAERTAKEEEKRAKQERREQERLEMLARGAHKQEKAGRVQNDGGIGLNKGADDSRFRHLSGADGTEVAKPASPALSENLTDARHAPGSESEQRRGADAQASERERMGQIASALLRGERERVEGEEESRAEEENSPTRRRTGTKYQLI